MNKAYTRQTFQNYPSTATPLNDVNLNKIDLGLSTVDDRVITLDTTKANQADYLGCVTGITYNTQTGVFVFTKANGTSLTVDLNIEKIPVHFSMSEVGVITMETEDGTEYTCDIRDVIKTYTFVDSSVIDFTVTSSGNTYTVTADIVDGSITADKLQPNFLADCEAAQEGAEDAEADAVAKALVAEGFAVGKQNGVAVTEGSPYYQNNAEYFKNQAQSIVGGDFVAYDSVQSRSDSERAQARENIGAAADADLSDLSDDVSAHIALTVASQSGAHGLRYYNEKLQYHNGTTWIDIKTSTDVALAPPSNIVAMPGNEKVTLTWTDPTDVIVGSTTIAAWSGTKVVRKTGSAPISESDGTLVFSETVRNQHSEIGLDDTGLTNGTTYYYGIFPYTTEGLYTYSGTTSATPVNPTVTLTLTIEGAKNDHIYVYDGATLKGDCEFASGATSGTMELTIPSSGATYEFRSTVAAGLDGTGYYSKNVSLTNTSTSVKVMPYSARWYGNECADVVGSWGYLSSYKVADESSYPCTAGEIIDGNMYCVSTNSTHRALIGATPIDVTNFTKVKARIKSTQVNENIGVIFALCSTTNGWSDHRLKQISSYSVTSDYETLEADISTISGDAYVAFVAFHQGRGGYCDAVWLE